MAQTGISSAVGLCLESSWRDTPLTVLSGSNYNVGIFSSNPHRFWTVEPGGGVPAQTEVQTPDNEIDGDVQLIRTMKTAVSYNGGFSWKADGENLYYPLLGMFGRDVQTTLQSASSSVSANVYSHVFTPNKYAPSFSLEEIFGDSTYARLSGGCVVQSLELDFSRVMMARLTLVPYRQVPNVYANASNVQTDYLFGSATAVIPSQMSATVADGTKTWSRTGTPTYIDVLQEQPTMKQGNGPFVFGAVALGTAGTSPISAPGFGNPNTAFLTIDDTAYAVELLEGFTVAMSRKIDANMVAGSGYDPGACTGSQFSVSGKFNILFKDLNIQMATLRHSKIALNFQIVGVVPGTAGTVAYAIEVFLPNCRFTVPEGPNVIDGPIIVGGTYVARKDPTYGYAIRIALKNTFNAATLGGAYPLNPTDAVLTASTSAGAATAAFTNARNVVKGDIHTFQEAGVNGGAAVSKTVLSVAGNTVTYTSNVGFVFTVAATVTRNLVNGLGGWSNY